MPKTRWTHPQLHETIQRAKALYTRIWCDDSLPDAERASLLNEWNRLYTEIDSMARQSGYGE